MTTANLITLVVILLGSSTTAQIIGQVMAWRTAKKAKAEIATVAAAAARTAQQAKEDQAQVQRNQELAQDAAKHAAEQVVEAARLLIETGAITSQKLDAVKKAAEDSASALLEVATTGQATHKIVNNQRTVMLRLIATMARRIAKENPDDLEAQKAWRDAEADLAAAEGQS